MAAASPAPSSTFVPIPPNELAGAIVVNVFAILSTLALCSIFVRVTWLAGLRFLGHDISQSFFNTQLGYYAACLLISNMVNGIAGLMGLPFLVNHGITDNAICTAQATVMQIGNLATAYFTVAIAVHTFNSLVLRKRQSVYFYASAIALGWIVSVVIALVPLIAQVGPVYGPSGLACGVRTTLPKQMFLLHLLPIFIAAVISVVLYSLIFLVLRGTLVVKGGLRLNLNPHDRTGDQFSGYYQHFVAGIAKSMLWYPAAYILLLVPYSVTRLLSLGGFVIPFQAMVFAFVCWFALGVVNALLLFNTFRILEPAFDAKSTSEGKKADLESFGTSETFKRLTVDMRMPRHLNLTDRMIQEYRGTDGSIISSPTTYTSTQSPEPSLPERALSPQNSRSSPYISEKDLNREISPVSTLNRSITIQDDSMPPARSTPARVVVAEHIRQESDSTVVSLPIPPRRTPPPLASRPPINHMRASSADKHASPTSSPLRSQANPFSNPKPSPTSYRVRNQVRDSSTSVELDITGWLAQQNADGSMPRGIRNQPLLSAVRPSFPSPTVPDPTASPSARLRPLLLASVERTGSPILAQHYERLYRKESV